MAYEYDPNAGSDASDLNFDFDLSDTKSLKDLDIAGGGLPPGKYVVFAQEVTSEQGKSPLVKFVFVVKSGQSKGKKHNERVFLTAAAMPRAKLFAKALDLVREEDCGKSSVRRSWADAVNKDVVIGIKEEEYVKNDGTKGKSSKMTYNGIWKTNDPLVADVVSGKATAGATATAGAGTGNTQQASSGAKDTFDDL